jgi:hypothetical protein
MAYTRVIYYLNKVAILRYGYHACHLNIYYLKTKAPFLNLNEAGHFTIRLTLVF